MKVKKRKNGNVKRKVLLILGQLRWKHGKYDLVFSSPPYEYLEVYEHMKNYENNGNITQNYSSKLIKPDNNLGFYDSFIIPTLKNAYNHLPNGKFMCLNIPENMYIKISQRWRKCDKIDTYYIAKRVGSNKSKRNKSEFIYCWQKKG